MVIVITTTSILVITCIIWLLNKVLPFRVCPICAGVSGTWIWVLAGIYANLLPAADYRLPAAMMIGGSVVGIAYQVKKFLPAPIGWRTPLLWKALFISGGFVSAHFLLSFRWLEFLIMTSVLLLLMPLFLRSPQKHGGSSGNKVGLDENKEKRVEMLEAEMEECC